MTLTPTRRLGRQRRLILAEIISRPGDPPKYRELMALCGVRSPHAITQHLRALRRMQLVDWEPGLAATVRATCRMIPAAELAAETTNHSGDGHDANRFAS